MEENLTFEERLEAANSIVAMLESGKLPLEEAVRKYEQGLRLLKELEKELNETEQRLTVLREDMNGNLSEQPMEGFE